MNRRIGICVAILVGLSAALSHAAPLAPPTKSAVLSMGAGCRVALQVPIEAEVGSAGPAPGIPGRGGLSSPLPPTSKRNTYLEPFSLRFVCHDASDENLLTGRPVAFDPSSGKWRRYFPNRIQGANNPGMTLQEERLLDRAIRFYELSSKNAQGFAYTEDMTVGDERYRARKLHYCLIHPPKAICGDSEVGNLNDIRRSLKNDLTPYALQILRSVEFLDDAQPSIPASAPGEAASTPR